MSMVLAITFCISSIRVEANGLGERVEANGLGEREEDHVRGERGKDHGVCAYRTTNWGERDEDHEVSA